MTEEVEPEVLDADAAAAVDVVAEQGIHLLAEAEAEAIGTVRDHVDVKIDVSRPVRS